MTTPCPQSILFSSDQTGNHDIYLYDLETGHETNLTDHPANDMNPQVNANGDVVFTSDRDGDYDIYAVNLHHP